MTRDDISSHDQLESWLAEQSLGILDGRARAELLAHVESCASCATELEAYTQTADALVHLAPGIEPPVGFESRTLERMRAQAAPARRRAPLLAAVAACVVLAFGLGWLTQFAIGSAPATPRVAVGHVAERGLLGGGRTVGAAYMYTGSPSWMFITVSLPGDPRAVRCTVLTSDGRRHMVGTFSLAAGHGAWGTPLSVSFASVRGIMLSTARGAPIAQLSHSAWSYAARAAARGVAISRYL